MPSPTDKLFPEYSSSVRRLHSQRKAYLARGFVSAAVTAAAAAFLALLAGGTVLSGWRYWPLACFVIFWADIAAAAVFSYLSARKNSRSLAVLADEVGSKTGDGSLFSSALEFSENIERREPYSGFLVAKTVTIASQKLQRVSPVDLFWACGKPGATVLAAVLSVTILVFAITGRSQTGELLRSIGDPRISFSFEPGYNLFLTEARSVVIAGDDVTVGAVRAGSLRGNVEIIFSSVPGVLKREEVSPAEDLHDSGRLEVFRHTFRDAEEDIEYYFSAGTEETGRGYINVIHRPVINRIGAVLNYPEYTGKEPDTLSSLPGKTAVLPGTRAVLSGEASKPVAGARLESMSGNRIDLDTEGNRFSGQITVEKSDTIRFSVTDPAGLVSDSSVRYAMLCVPDKKPFIEILSPEDKAALPRSLETTVLFRASDDYGVARVDLRYMKEGRDREFLSLPIEKGNGGSPKEIERRYLWSLAGERVFPGDRIAYYMEAWDNNLAGGPGYSRTPTFTMTVPSLSDLYARVRTEEETRKEDFRDIVEESKEVREKLRKFSDELRADGRMNWERGEEGREILDIQEKIREKIRITAEKIGRDLRELEENRMTSMEIGRKIEEIQDLLEQIENEDLSEAISMLQEMIEKMPESEVSPAMDEINMRAGELSERLDRTVDLLNRIIREERMEELLRRMEEMIESQIALRDSIGSGELEEAAREEKELNREYNSIETDMKDLALGDFDEGAQSDREELMKKIEGAEIDHYMKEAVARMEDEERSKAMAAANDAVNEMLSLYTALGRFQMSMNIAVDAEAARILESSAQRLLEVSRISERFSGKTARGSARYGLDDLLEDQAVIRDAVRRVMADLLEAARKSLGISRIIFDHLSAALLETEELIASLEDRKFANASGMSGRVMTELNLAAVELLRTSSSSGGSGGDSGDGMQSLLNGQASIDRQLKQMIGGESADSPESRASMARMAAEQRKMEELLRRISEESRGAGRALGELEKLGPEMKKIADQLGEGILDRDLINREERILSRMLESHRSLNRRDYKRERVSETAGDIAARDAEAKTGEKDEIEFILEKIRDGMQKKGPAEYEELIRAYFRALSREVREGAAR